MEKQDKVIAWQNIESIKYKNKLYSGAKNGVKREEKGKERKGKERKYYFSFTR
ncbi:hypothetical protein NC803_08590 [Brenneria sp. KBI 447]|uniref:Uncharacterized protein n=1 Tax=Brenneria izbisi TaxID=2939450 RepID=A0AA41XUS2_9GAMM|nr:hypothetical protein [Brenneria izbisi]